MIQELILQELASHEAVLSGSHFVYTSGMHGTAYIDVRAAAHDSTLMAELGHTLGLRLMEYEPQLVIGPEPLGRTLAYAVAASNDWNVPAIWCDMIYDENYYSDRLWKKADFSPKFNFGRLIKPGMDVVVVDDLITTGDSIRLTAELVGHFGGNVVAGGAVIRRDQSVGAEQCGVPALEVLAEVEGFAAYSGDECRKSGPCSKQVPMMLRPGYGHRWIKQNPDYPIVG